MDLSSILDLILAKAPWLLSVLQLLGGLVVLGSSYVLLTPSKSDDGFVAKIEAIPVLGSLLKLISSFSPVQKK